MARRSRCGGAARRHLDRVHRRGEGNTGARRHAAAGRWEGSGRWPESAFGHPAPEV